MVLIWPNFLLDKGYEVHGIKRRASLFNTNRIDHIYQDLHHEKQVFFLHYGDLTDSLNIVRLVQEIQPDEIYNLGAQSHVAVSFESPEYTADVDAIGTLRLLEAIRICGLEKKNSFLSSLYLGIIWVSARNTSKGDYTILSKVTLCSS